MHYLATIKFSTLDTYCKSFDTEKEAQQWLDSQNNNAECHTTIDYYNDQWQKVRSITYTEGNK